MSVFAFLKRYIGMRTDFAEGEDIMEKRKSLHGKARGILRKILVNALLVIAVITFIPTVFITVFWVNEGIESTRAKMNVGNMSDGEEVSVHASVIISDGKELDVKSEIERVCNESDLIGKYTAYAEKENIEFESIVIYPDTYYILNISAKEFNEGLAKLNADGFRGDMFSSARHIYVPIFAKTAEGEKMIAAEIMYFRKDKGKVLSQDEWGGEPYFSFGAISSIKDITSQYKAEDCVWVMVSTEHYPYTMPLLLIKTDREYNVLDYSGIVEHMSEPVVYSPYDYVEKKEAKDDSIIRANKRLYLYPTVFVIAVPTVCVLSCTLYFALRRRKNGQDMTDK